MDSETALFPAMENLIVDVAPNRGVNEFSPELLKMYYQRIFPIELMTRWFAYGSQHEGGAAANLFHRRELSFTTGDDVYIRYLSYEDADAFKKDLIHKLPYKIDIGAVFNAAPRDHKKFKLFEPLQREFIIDIDLTDYDFLEECDPRPNLTPPTNPPTRSHPPHSTPPLTAAAAATTTT